MPYVLFQSRIRIGLWRIIIMTIVIVSQYKLPCTVFVYLRVYILSFILCRPSGLTNTPEPLNTHPTIKDLYHSLGFFYHSINCPQNVKLYFSVGCRKVNDRHAVCPPKQRLSAALRTWSISVFLLYVIVLAKICDPK